jgi:Zinc carboxypeptidase/Immune inhibitor A-like, MAM domain
MRVIRRRPVAVVSALALLGAGALAVLPAEAQQGNPQGVGLEVYVGEVDAAGVQSMREMGLDAHDFIVEHEPRGGAQVEVVLSEAQAAKLSDEGVDLEVKQVDGVDASEALEEQAAQGWEPFRSYSEPGGIRDEILETAADNDALTEVVNIGSTVNGQDILAVKVTAGADTEEDGSRPAVLYASTQHAREWITPEMTRRLMHYVLDNYGTDAEITELVDTTELWFLPVANPDGYDFTFTEGNRLWRKNLRDNNGDGVITVGDGVDLNRNFATKWGYDNEGSSPDPASDTYRGLGPNSEPETQALDGLFASVGFEFFVNYHSAAELLLYGIGWQVNTPSPDDVIYEAMVGTDNNPAVPGYDPDISAELYTTNGDTDTHAQVEYGTLGFTPEMSTCQAASNSVPNDEWLAEDCVSGFIFPNDEELIQAEFEKNIPFALAVAQSTHDPDDPVIPTTVPGSDAPDLVADPFTVSYGTSQQVAVTAKRSLVDVTLNYSINGGAPATTTVEEWEGGERYGDTHDVYYGEFRGTIAAEPGDDVEVWFTGANTDGGGQDAVVRTAPFTYTVHDDIGSDVLIVAAEDTTGISPVQGVRTAQYADEYASSLEAAGYSSDVYDFDTMGRQAPHHLGVLSHYDAVVWETGNDIILRSRGQVPSTTAKAAVDLELAMRDYVNEGGKLLHAGKFASFAQGANGAYWYNPFATPECRTPGQYPCLQVFNDFQQYWLGTYVNVDDGGTDENGEPFPLVGEAEPYVGFTGDLNADGSAQNQDHTALLLTTSSFLPPAEFPQFASEAPLDWDIPGGPFDPHTGGWYVYSQQADASYKRLSRTVDLTNATSGELRFWSSYDTEFGWDHLFVEAHPVGSDDWTTLPDANGHTQTGTGESCPAGWSDLHPFITHYQGPNCEPTGTTGDWNAATGSSQGWSEWSVDLSDYAGQQVEVSISYVSDWSVQGIGVFLDDVSVLVDGSNIDADPSFESGLGPWTPSGAPEGSAANANDWTRTQLGFEEGAAVTTEDTVYFGFGLEGLAQGERDDLVARTMSHLLG